LHPLFHCRTGGFFTTLHYTLLKKVVKVWCIYTTPLELILSEIPEKSNARRPLGGGQEKPHGSRAKNFLP